MMTETDWFVGFCALFTLGAGTLMTALGSEIVRIGGAVCMAVAGVALIFWFGYYR
jgi:hypothetical protein